MISKWSVPQLVYQDSVLFEKILTCESNQPQIFKSQLSINDDRNENNELNLEINSTGNNGAVVFNEIMYDPDAGMSEWIELLNTTANHISLHGWSFCDGNGISDTTDRVYFPDLILDSMSYCILAADSAILFQTIPATVPIVIWHSSIPSLNNTGDSLELFDAADQVIDRIDYRPSWGGDEAGRSLERITINSPTNSAQNWATSLDSTGSTPGRANSRAVAVPDGQANLLTLEPQSVYSQ